MTKTNYIFIPLFMYITTLVAITILLGLMGWVLFSIGYFKTFIATVVICIIIVFFITISDSDDAKRDKSEVKE